MRSLLGCDMEFHLSGARVVLGVDLTAAPDVARAHASQTIFADGVDAAGQVEEATRSYCCIHSDVTGLLSASSAAMIIARL
jgi:hypothetical protein